MLAKLLKFLIAPLKWLLTLPGKLFKASIPAKVTALVAVFLILLVLAAVLIQFLEPDMVPFFEVWTASRYLTVGVLMIVIPIVVYWTLRFWLEGGSSRYPDIDRAWKAGIEELERQDLDPAALPIFLVMGSSSEVYERALIQAAGLKTIVHGVPERAAALHWYATESAVYLFCSETSVVSKLASISTSFNPRKSSQIIMSRPDAEGTMVPGQRAPSATDSVAGAEPSATGSVVGSIAGSIQGTISGSIVEDYGGGGGGGGSAPKPKVPKLNDEDMVEQANRLDYVCELLSRLRKPVCPINGIMMLLPFKLLDAGPGPGRELQRSAKSDLRVLYYSLKLRCPVTTLVTGMEGERGFLELVKRVGRDRAQAQRLGKGFSPWGRSTSDQMRAVARNACGVFEDLIYSKFRESGALSKPGNSKLYGLLCRIRGQFQDRLEHLLANAFAEEEPGESLLFGGCYFGATGIRSEHHAFVRGVFAKLPEQQADLEWTEEAFYEDHRNRKIGYGIIGVDAVLALLIVGLIAYKWFLSDGQ